MPLDSGSDKATVSNNIREMLRSSTFAAGKSQAKRQQMAAAAAYNKARSGKKGPAQYGMGLGAVGASSGFIPKATKKKPVQYSIGGAIAGGAGFLAGRKVAGLSGGILGSMEAIKLYRDGKLSRTELEEWLATHHQPEQYTNGPVQNANTPLSTDFKVRKVKPTTEIPWLMTKNIKAASDKPYAIVQAIGGFPKQPPSPVQNANAPQIIKHAGKGVAELGKMAVRGAGGLVDPKYKALAGVGAAHLKSWLSGKPVKYEEETQPSSDDGHDTTAEERDEPTHSGTPDGTLEQLWEECQKLIPETMPTKFPAEIGQIDGCDVCFVDGDETKTTDDEPEDSEHPHMDFVEAANDLEAPWVKREYGEKYFLLDCETDIKWAAFNLFHEAVERRYMEQGMSYDQAHHIACAAEKERRLQCRHEDDPVEYICVGDDGGIYVYAAEDWMPHGTSKNGVSRFKNIKTGQIRYGDPAQFGAPKAPQMTQPEIQPAAQKPTDLGQLQPGEVDWSPEQVEAKTREINAGRLGFKAQQEGRIPVNMGVPEAPTLGREAGPMSDEQEKAALRATQAREAYLKKQQQLEDPDEHRNETDNQLTAEALLQNKPNFDKETEKTARPEMMKQPYYLDAKEKYEQYLKYMEAKKSGHAQKAGETAQHVLHGNNKEVAANLQTRTPEQQEEFRAVAPQVAEHTGNHIAQALTEIAAAGISEKARHEMANRAKAVAPEHVATAHGSLQGMDMSKLTAAMPPNEAKGVQMAVEAAAAPTEQAMAHSAAMHSGMAVASEAAHSPQAAQVVEKALPVISNSSAAASTKAGQGTAQEIIKNAAAIAPKRPGLLVPAIAAGVVAAASYAAYHVSRSATRAALEAARGYEAHAAAAATQRDGRAIHRNSVAHGKQVAMLIAGGKAAVRDSFRNFTAPGLVGQLFGVWQEDAEVVT